MHQRTPPAGGRSARPGAGLRGRAVVSRRRGEGGDGQRRQDAANPLLRGLPLFQVPLPLLTKRRPPHGRLRAIDADAVRRARQRAAGSWAEPSRPGKGPRGPAIHELGAQGLTGECAYLNSRPPRGAPLQSLAPRGALGTAVRRPGDFAPRADLPVRPSRASDVCDARSCVTRLSQGSEGLG